MAPTVLVTGGSSGIGLASALAFARTGARLVLLARSPGRLADAVCACEHAGGTALACPGDVLDSDAVARAFALAREAFGGPDIVVHSVGVVAYGDLTQVPRDVWERAVDTSVHGTAVVARAALESFGVGAGIGAQRDGVQPEGTLVVVGSVLGQVTVPHMSSYVTGKWAVRGLVRCLQQEARVHHPRVRIALVDPGAVNTPIYRLAGAYGGRQGSPPPPVISPDLVATRVLAAAEGGRRVRGAGPANPLMRLGFTLTPRVYDLLVGPLMRLGGLRGGDVPAHAGNVAEPSEAVESAQDSPRGEAR